MILAHQGGWDEILLVLTPIAIFAGLLWLANARANKELQRRRSAAEDPAPTVVAPRRACPCCRSLTLPSEASEPSGPPSVCPVCAWHDDEAQAADPTNPVGANRTSLEEARRYYREIGAADPAAVHHVRRPTPEERPAP